MGNPDELNHLHSEFDASLNASTEEQNQEIDNKLHKTSTTSIINLNSQNLTLFPKLENGSLGFPSQITHLNVNYNCITKLPQGLPQVLLNLQSFSLDGNELSKLPDDFGDLSSLEELYINENKLTSLPHSLCKLTKLRILKACGNVLRSLHPEIGQNACLETLSVDENHLKRFPPTLGLLKKLKVLEANSNKLSCLPDTVHFLESLETVDLSKNRLSSIPNSFSELHRLKHIDLSENQLVSLWEPCKSASCLEKLFLDFNSIITLPSWFSDLVKASDISLNSNNLSCSSIPERFGNNLSRLQNLDLRGNFIIELPNSFGNLHALKTLLLGTPFDYLEKRATFQNGNWLRWFPTTFVELHNLVLLAAQENQLAFLPDNFGDLTNLEELYLGSNLLASLPASFCSLHVLKKCQLSKNKIKALPKDIGNLEALTELHLDSNKLKWLPSSMKKCVAMEILDLADNKLSVIPNDIITALPQLRALSMHQNRFDVPYSDIPHIAKKSHYQERNPLQRDNWRGRNNRPYAVDENQLQTNEREDQSNSSMVNGPASYCGIDVIDCDSNENEESGDSNEKNAFWDSSEDEDWEKECSQSGQLNQPSQNVVEEEENWDNEVTNIPCKNQSTDFEIGQFDLDEECSRKQSLIEPVSFDFYGNPSRRIDIDLFCQHRMLPYVIHSRNHFPFSYEPVSLEQGQFDDLED